MNTMDVQREILRLVVSEHTIYLVPSMNIAVDTSCTEVDTELMRTSLISSILSFASGAVRS